MADTDAANRAGRAGHRLTKVIEFGLVEDMDINGEPCGRLTGVGSPTRMSSLGRRHDP
jgi:hypothetical protein